MWPEFDVRKSGHGQRLNQVPPFATKGVVPRDRHQSVRWLPAVRDDDRDLQRRPLGTAYILVELAAGYRLACHACLPCVQVCRDLGLVARHLHKFLEYDGN